MISIRYHVVDSMEEWLALECHCVETVMLQEPKIPRFDFNMKIFITAKRKDFFIPGCAIAGLKEIKNYIKLNNISYKPSNHIKFAFDYIDSGHCFKQSEAPKPKRLYPQPIDIHVAQAVAAQLFDTEDSLGTEDDDKVVYYYLSVLRAVDHPVINHARYQVIYHPDDQNLFDSALIPQCERQCTQVKYYSWYADLIYFLSLMAPPICAGDTVAKITAKVRARNEEQLKILSQTVGITNYKPTDRGEGWQKLTKFFEASPMICRLIATSILKPPTLETPLTVIEDQVMRQLKELWQWTGLYNFRDCYMFAVSADTEAHKIPVVADQCEEVKRLYKKLRMAVGEDHLIPYAKLLVDDGQFFEQYHVKNYPDLFYATRSKMVGQKVGNALWEEFVATRPVTIPRQEIDEKLMIPIRDKEKELDEPDQRHFEFFEENFTIESKADNAGRKDEILEDILCERVEGLSRFFKSDSESEDDDSDAADKRSNDFIIY